MLRNTVIAYSLSTIIATATVLPGQVSAQDDKVKDAKVAPLSLTPEELAEREGRKACKIELCTAFRAHRAGPDIQCNITKSWRKQQLDKMMKKARVSWPWGPVVCKADIDLKRDELIKSTTEPKYELQLTKHTVSCTVQREKDTADIKFSFAPKVSFEEGIATNAALNWGKIEAPTLVKGAMWTATATDNTFNVLQSMLVKDINAFIKTGCDEVKAGWQ